ncbi:MAG: hypothetical protein HFE46_05680 [Clostridia bacterium]|jgi:hypothetical protein|nr:hypothetical protein [Clostridia bacterium]
MATKRTKTTRTTTQTRVYTVPKICKVLSFVAVMLMGLGIAIGVVLGFIEQCAAIGNWIKNIAIGIGLIALCWYSYYEARLHGRTWFTLWVIAVVLIVVFYVLGLTPIVFWNK